MFCDRCGTKNRPEALFCRSCGTAVEDPRETPTIEMPAGAPSDVPDRLVRAFDGRFRIERLLGRGGMGEVYLARELALDRDVALKVLPADSADAIRLERFFQEARLAARLRHPNVVGLHGVGELGGIAYFTMDYVDGCTLEAYVRGLGGRLPPGRARELLSDVAQAVRHAHREGVVHRDLKPANVMIDRRGHVTVMDFGLARLYEGTGLTSSGIVVGTPQYVSPEQLEGRPASPRSDVYALGLILFFLLEGEHLVSGDSVSSVVTQHLTGSFLERVAAATGIGEPVRILLLEMLARQPEGRPDVDEVIGRLGEDQASGEVTPAKASVDPRATTVLPERPTPVPGASSPVASPRRIARQKMKDLLEKREKS